MEMRLRAPVTRGYFFLLGALRLVNAASPRNIDQKKISSGTQGTRDVGRTQEFLNYEPQASDLRIIWKSDQAIKFNEIIIDSWNFDSPGQN